MRWLVCWNEGLDLLTGEQRLGVSFALALILLLSWACVEDHVLRR